MKTNSVPAKQIDVAVLQLEAHDRHAFASRWPSIAAAVKQECRGTDLLVLPEGTIPSYVIGTEAIDSSATEQALATLCEIACAESTVIVCGIARTVRDGVHNSAAVIDADGSIAGYADKHFLWHFDRKWFKPGTELRPIRTSLGDLGVLVCADGRIPTIARTLADRGARALVMPTAWVTSGRNPLDLENVQADLLARVRAWENALPFVAANKCGTELGVVAYCGKSQIVDANGCVLALAPQDRAAVLRARIALARAPERSDPPVPEPVESPRGPVRIAITPFANEAAEGARLETIDASALIGPAESRIAGLPVAALDDAAVHDPAGTAAYRLAGYRLAVWRTQSTGDWQLDLARARALELRVFLVVVEDERRAYAIDPDGTVVCGTFGSYRIAAFTFDPVRTEQTTVAPMTDILEGLRDAAAASQRSAAGSR